MYVMIWYVQAFSVCKTIAYSWLQQPINMPGTDGSHILTHDDDEEKGKDERGGMGCYA